MRRASKKNNILFVFTGQGAQWARMGYELLEHHIFHQSMVRSREILYELGCKWDLLEELAKDQDSNIGLPQYSQPICTALQIALTDLVVSWGISPTSSVGHSSGEIGK